LATPLCVVVGWVSGNEKAHRVPGGLTVGSSCTRGLIPLHEAHLPAAKDVRVLGRPLAVDRLLRSIERAGTGISRQRPFDAVHGQHGGFLRSVAPRLEASLAEYIHNVRHCKRCFW